MNLYSIFGSNSNKEETKRNECKDDKDTDILIVYYYLFRLIVSRTNGLWVIIKFIGSLKECGKRYF